MFQGLKETAGFSCLPGAPSVRVLDAAVLTHTHLDHLGRVPLSAKAGYGDPIYATAAVLVLADLVLRDAAGIM